MGLERARGEMTWRGQRDGPRGARSCARQQRDDSTWQQIRLLAYQRRMAPGSRHGKRGRGREGEFTKSASVRLRSDRLVRFRIIIEVA